MSPNLSYFNQRNASDSYSKALLPMQEKHIHAVWTGFILLTVQQKHFYLDILNLHNELLHMGTSILLNKGKSILQIMLKMGRMFFKSHNWQFKT